MQRLQPKWRFPILSNCWQLILIHLPSLQRSHLEVLIVWAPQLRSTLSNSIAKSGACLETAPFVFTPSLASCATTETNSSLTPSRLQTPLNPQSQVLPHYQLIYSLRRRRLEVVGARKNERARGRHPRPFFLGPATQATNECLQQQLHSLHEVETSGKGAWTFSAMAHVFESVSVLSVLTSTSLPADAGIVTGLF